MMLQHAYNIRNYNTQFMTYNIILYQSNYTKLITQHNDMVVWDKVMVQYFHIIVIAIMITSTSDLQSSTYNHCKSTTWPVSFYMN